VFVQYQKLLHSDNYVTKRQSLKLLGELLLDRHNFSVSCPETKLSLFWHYPLIWNAWEDAEAVCLVRCLGRSQHVCSLSPLVNKLLGGILSWAQTLLRLFTERQFPHKVHAYLVHNWCLSCSQGTKNTKKTSYPSLSQFVFSSFITHSQMTKHTASGLRKLAFY
jgi:hypothetical protein